MSWSRVNFVLALIITATVGVDLYHPLTYEYEVEPGAGFTGMFLILLFVPATLAYWIWALIRISKARRSLGSCVYGFLLLSWPFVCGILVDSAWAMLRAREAPGRPEDYAWPWYSHMFYFTVIGAFIGFLLLPRIKQCVERTDAEQIAAPLPSEGAPSDGR